MHTGHDFVCGSPPLVDKESGRVLVESDEEVKVAYRAVALYNFIRLTVRLA
jgi:hypothetical protein